MKINNIANRYLELSSDSISKIIQNPLEYDRLVISYKRNCIDSSEVNVIIPFSTQLDCKGNDYNTFKYDMSMFKNQSAKLSTISFKHIVTGNEIVTEEINIDFAQYNIDCPSGCALDTLNGYYLEDLKFKIETKLLDNSLNTSLLDVYYCGDILYIKGLPKNIIPTNITLENGYKGLFSSSLGNNNLLLQENLYLTPSLFGTSLIEDGVYTISLSIYSKNGNYIKETNCFFVDNVTKCRVSEKLEFIISSEQLEVEMAQEIMTIYLGLSNGSNCGGCNCSELCMLYDRLNLLLSSSIIENENTIKIKTCNSGCE